MCGRYASTRNPAALAVVFDAVDATDDAAPQADYNVAPTKSVLSVVTRHPRDPDGVPDPDRTVRSLRVMRWGLIPHWAKDPKVGSRLINARAESAASKPAFRDAVAKRRCLLPADGWYEWQATAGRAGSLSAAGRAGSLSAAGRAGSRKQPFFITPAAGAGLALAGLWSTWRPADEPTSVLVTCAVLTTEAVGPLAEIHDRMPLILPAQQWQAWLDPDHDDPSELLAPPRAELVAELELRPVSTAVNDVRHAGPELVERVEPEQPALLDLDQTR
jgi:putative SOS response-associated peptidase YedK